MAITPADIQAQMFSEAKRGYDPGEVDEFLNQISSEVDAMLNKIVDLKGRLTETEQKLAEAQEQLAQRPADPIQPVQTAPTSGATESQISAALIAAQKAADGIVLEANQNADRIKAEADAKAREVIRRALEEKQQEMAEIDRLQNSREEFKNEYIKLVQHFMDEAQSSFPNDLLSTVVPTGSEAVAAAPAATAAPAYEATYTPVNDPFAPIDNFSDDLD